MFPEFRSGNINTLASPLILPFGFFLFATSGTNAESNCNSPSTIKVGDLLLVSSTALITFSVESLLALPLVENERNATWVLYR